MHYLPALYDHYLLYPDIVTDHRKVTDGSVFFALRGERFNGNEFAQKALDAGASLAVVDDPTVSGSGFLLVPDTLTALQELAKEHRRHLVIPVIGITGSNGKTTTKELLYTALSTRFTVNATKGNLNNHIGVPLTLLSVKPTDQILICEMGANHIGEIQALCDIAQPTHGLITNIGRAHIEGFGSLEGVKKAKGELFEFLSRHQGVGFVNMDDPALRDLQQILPIKITYSITGQPGCDFNFQLESNVAHSGFTLRDPSGEISISSGLFGDYNATNVVAAFVVGTHFNIDASALSQALAGFTSGANRSERISYRNCTIIKDAYNANPSSMERAIQAFAGIYPEGTVVLGDMKELGTESFHSHQELLALAASLPLSTIFIVGPEFEKVFKTFPADARIVWSPEISELKKNWDWSLMSGSALLIKGSRSMHLESLLEE